MESIREISEEGSTDVNYSDFQTVGRLDSIQQLRQDMRAEVVTRQLQEEKCSLSCSLINCFEIVVLVVMVCLIWLAMSVPSALYLTTLFNNGNNSTIPTNYSNRLNSSSTMCMTQEYTGSQCRDQLANLQRCFYNRSDFEQNTSIYISSSVDQEAQEDLARLLTGSLDYFSVNRECLYYLIPFTCLYLFPLGFCEEAEVVGPSPEQCRFIKDNVCRELWNNASRLLPSSLPDCEALDDPYEDILKDCKDMTPVTHEELNCTSDFISYYDNNTGIVRCVPECQRWSAFTPNTILITNILIILATSSAILTGTAVLILGCIRCKKIYPSVFVIYQTIPLMLLALLVLIGFTARTKLFCTSSNLISSIGNPTPFCIITGLAFHYFILQLLVWWICHVFAVFLGTLFPFCTKRWKSTGKLKYVHGVMVVLGLTLPIGPVAILALKGGISLTRHPTILCVSLGEKENFACMVIPISFIIAVGSTMLIFILRIVIKRHVQARMHQLRVRLNWITEAKVLTILMYYLILGAVVLTILTSSLTRITEFITETTTYFACEGLGVSDGMEPRNSTCDRSRVERLVSPIPTTIAFIVLGLYPAINLVYVINIKEIKEKICRDKRKVEIVHIKNHFRGNIQSVHLRQSIYSRAQVTSSFESIYTRPSTFRPASQVANVL